MNPDDLSELEYPARVAKASGFKQVTIDVDHVLELIEALKKAEGLSPAWVLNQLAGHTFPGAGEAYDFMKRCIEIKP